MNSRTKRTVAATVALGAAGLLGSLPFDGSSAGQGAPTVHRDVALVDVTSELLSSETALDNTLYAAVVSEESMLYNDTASALGVLDTDVLLGATNSTDLFDGAYNSFGSGVFLDTWAAEDELNTLLGGNAAESEAGILADIAKDPVLLPAGDVLPAAGASGFDTTLMTFASGDFANATTEFTTYLDGLTGLDSLGGLLGDLGLGSLGDGVGGLGGDLTSILDGLVGLL